jgi:CheY-like chemotaxis protein
MATVLVVEDHRVSQLMYRYILRKHGHTVLLAENGQAALAYLENGTVDLLITDLAMPHMDGLSLLKHLRNTERHHTLPVIMLTVNWDDQEHEQQLARKEGANACLAKPVSSRELIQTVLSLLGGRIIGGQI